MPTKLVCVCMCMLFRGLRGFCFGQQSKKEKRSASQASKWLKGNVYERVTVVQRYLMAFDRTEGEKNELIIFEQNFFRMKKRKSDRISLNANQQWKNTIKKATNRNTWQFELLNISSLKNEPKKCKEYYSEADFALHFLLCSSIASDIVSSVQSKGHYVTMIHIRYFLQNIPYSGMLFIHCPNSSCDIFPFIRLISIVHPNS